MTQRVFLWHCIRIITKGTRQMWHAVFKAWWKFDNNNCNINNLNVYTDYLLWTLKQTTYIKNTFLWWVPFSFSITLIQILILSICGNCSMKKLPLLFLDDQGNTVHNCRAILNLSELMEMAIFKKWGLNAELELKGVQNNVKHILKIEEYKRIRERKCNQWLLRQWFVY